MVYSWPFKTGKEGKEISWKIQHVKTKNWIYIMNVGVNCRFCFIIEKKMMNENTIYAIGSTKGIYIHKKQYLPQRKQSINQWIMYSIKTRLVLAPKNIEKLPTLHISRNAKYPLDTLLGRGLYKQNFVLDSCRGILKLIFTSQVDDVCRSSDVIFRLFRSSSVDWFQIADYEGLSR